MLRCTNCRIEIVTKDCPMEDGFSFCSGLCRYEWRRKGKVSPFATGDSAQSTELPATTTSRFAIEPPGFEGRQMEVQLSFWRLPFLYLDGSRLRPTKSRFFRRRREYLATSNFGKSAVLHLQAGPLDPVPYLRIDGQIFRVCRKLRVWEQIWIALPLALMMFGGALGGLLGASAVYANALLLRRIRPWLPRFVVTGVVSFVSLQGYFVAASVLNPTVAAFQLGLNYQDSISPERDLLTSRAWVSAGRFDSAGSAITVDPRYDTGARVYFMGNGLFTVLSNQGLRADGRWSLDLTTQLLSLTDPAGTFDVVLQHIDPGYLVLRGPLFETRYTSEIIVPTDQDATPAP